MIDFKNVWKSYGSQDILNGVSFRINRNEHVGLVGPNGTGKTTIFQMISGEISPDKGSIDLPRGMRIGYLRQTIKDASDIPVVEFSADALPELSSIHAELRNLEHQLAAGENNPALLARHGELQHKFEHLGGYRLKSEAEAALCGLGFTPDALNNPLSSFSGGWQMRAALAKTLLSKPDILLLDEPSNYLDIPAVEWLYRYLRSFQGTLILISHDRFLLKSLTRTTLELNSGEITRYQGDYDFYVRERDNRLKSLTAAKRNLDRRKDQLQKSIERFRSKSTKASQVQSWVKTLDKMEDINLPQNLHYSGTITLPEAPPSGEETAALEDISFAYPESPELFKSITLRFNRGEKVAFVGYNGTGKTTLLKIIGGILSPKNGRRQLGHKVVTGYQAQEFADILPDEQSVYDVVRAALPSGSPEKNLMNILGAFGFSGEGIDKTCKVLSGGEKIRLCFARIFVNPPNLLILDEPTTHLDIAAREALQDALRQYQGTLCLVSHDIEFIRAVAEYIIAMEPGGARKYFGDYDYYRAKLAENASAENNPAKEQAASSANPANRKEQRRERAEKRSAIKADLQKAKKEVTRLEKLIDTLEAEKAELSAGLADMNGTGIAEAGKRLKEIQTGIETATGKWEQAAERLEELLEINAAIHS